MTTTGWAVVTGASGGLGRGFATKLAADGMPLVLVARSAGVLHDLADELTERYGVEVEVLAADLADPGSRDRVVADLATRQVELLVNNAGFGTLSEFADSDPSRMAEEIGLNCVALSLLARAVVTGMVARGSGAIVNVASTASFQPIPGMGVYAATKAYVLNLSLAMWEELRPHGVSVLALCPGPTETNFFVAAGNESAFAARRTVDQVVQTCFDALAKGSPVAVDGPLNSLMAWSTRLVPTRLAMTLARMMAGGRH
jgi:short-subunit dehydrogenase